MSPSLRSVTRSCPRLVPLPRHLRPLPPDYPESYADELRRKPPCGLAKLSQEEKAEAVAEWDRAMGAWLGPEPQPPEACDP